MTIQFPLSGPMSVGDLLDRAFRFYRARFGVFLLTAAIFLVPVWIIIYPGLPDISVELFLWNALAFTAANGLVMLVLSARMIEELHGRVFSIGEGIRRGLRRIMAYAGMSVTAWVAMIAVTVIAYVFVVFASAFVIGILAILPNPTLPANPVVEFGPSVLFVCAAVLRFIMVYFPAFYLYSRWLAAPAVLIAEQSGPLKSLGRSWELSRGYSMRVTGYTLLLFILMALVNFLPLAILAYVVVLLPNNLSELAAAILGWTTFFLLWVVSVPFYIGAVVLIYYDLRIRNEGYHLELRLAQMEEQVSRDAGERAP